ncbi:MAG: hypothetical protein QOJ11_2424 [Frankiales bacterium]|jgi:hypothetical protein|nr:hypothetical protein [Frankiales bacterium]
MTVLADRTEPISWVAVVERGESSGDGRPAVYGPMHAARGGTAITACGQPIETSSGRRALSQVAFASIADVAATMVCGGCRRAVHRDPDGQLG